MLSPQPFGFPAGYWVDFPDIATTDTHMYVTVNVITPTPWQNVDSLVVKFPLAELRADGAVHSVFWTRGATRGPGRNYRLVQGATTTMRFASHPSTTTLRIFRNDDQSNLLTWVDRPLAAWNDQDSGRRTPAGATTSRCSATPGARSRSSRRGWRRLAAAR